MGFHFCFTSAVMSPGCHHGQGSPCSCRSIRVGGSWFLCSVRTTNQVIALTLAPKRWMQTALQREQYALPVEFAKSLSFNSSTVYSSSLWTTRVPLFSDSSVMWGIRFGRWAYITISKHFKCCSHFTTKHLGLSFNEYCISLKTLWEEKKTKNKRKKLSCFLSFFFFFFQHCNCISTLQSCSRARYWKFQCGLKGRMWIMN